MTYVKVRQGDDVLYLIKDRLPVLRGGFEVLEELPGRDLVGVRYAGPFDELPAQQGVEHRVFEWDEVSASEGTGVVHNAPGAGREDFALGKQFGLPVIAPLDESGYFIDGFGGLSGRSVFEVNDDIYASLRDKGLLYHVERYSHRYPVCWRCDTELVWRLVDEWFISMDELRGLIAGVTEKITWIPEFGKQRELDWLRNMDDWMISKKRYWGLALPIFRCECGRFEVIGSREELEARAVAGWDEFEGHSPHRPWIDAVKIDCSGCGATVSRIADVGNPWLDAGIVPFSTLGYKTSPEQWREWFPADWISESFPGQFRNWFYSLLTMSTVLEGAEPFRTVFSYALMRDEKGEEMHKSKGNAIWFEEAAERMGVDSMRWLYARHSPAANLNFGYGNADEVRRRFIIPLWNVYSFFVTYANIDRYDPAAAAPPYGERAELDRWILSELNSTVAEVTAALDGFEPDRATRRVEQLIEHLSNWYVRRSRRRFWKAGVLGGDGAEDGDADKLGAYATLYECLATIVRLLAPFIPFVTESMYRNLAGPAAGGAESVHLDSYPVADPALIDPRLAEDTRLAMRLSSMGRAARSKAGIKVRQPLASRRGQAAGLGRVGEPQPRGPAAHGRAQRAPHRPHRPGGRGPGVHGPSQHADPRAQVRARAPRDRLGAGGRGPGRGRRTCRGRPAGGGRRLHAGAGRGARDRFGPGGVLGRLGRRVHGGREHDRDAGAGVGGPGPRAGAPGPEPAAVGRFRHRRLHRHLLPWRWSRPGGRPLHARRVRQAGDPVGPPGQRRARAGGVLRDARDRRPPDHAGRPEALRLAPCFSIGTHGIGPRFLSPLRCARNDRNACSCARNHCGLAKAT